MESEYEKNLCSDYNKFIKALGNTLRQGRLNLGFETIEPLANLADINLSTIGKYERGDENITIKRLYTLLRVLGKSHEEIIEMFKILFSNTPNKTITLLSKQVEQQVRLQVESTLGKEIAQLLNPSHINRIYLILVYCNNKTLKKTELKDLLKLDSYTRHFNKCLKISTDLKWINMTNPEKPNANDQSYYTTETGKEVLRLKQEEDHKTASEDK